MLKKLKQFTIYFNAKDQNNKWPKRYRAEFIEPGICAYNDIDAGIIFIGTETLDKMNESFIGKPVINEIHNEMTADEAFKLSNEDLESRADGVIYDVGKLSNGWYYCDYLVWDNQTKKNIEENDYSVSCAYFVTETGKSGEYHTIPYNEEVLNGVYTHLCITNTPRYEGAKTYELPPSYQNSKADEICKILNNAIGEKNMKKNVFKYLLNSAKSKNLKNECGTKKNESEEDKKPDEMENAEGAVIEVDGQLIPLEEAIAAYQAMNENQEEEPQTLSPEDTIDIDGESVSVADLIAAIKASKENAEPPQDEEAETIVEDQKTVSNSKKDPKKNHFKIVKNAVKETEDNKIYVNTSEDRIKRGKQRYGKREVTA